MARYRMTWSTRTKLKGGQKPKVKDRFGCTPRKGTKLRRFLMATLRPQGCTGHEAEEIFGRDGGGGSAGSALQVLLDQKGWEVRAFRYRKDLHAVSPDHSNVVYRCVGRMRWDGTYRSFVRGD